MSGLPRHHGPSTTGSGVPELDHVLGGLFWGDNVVWEFHDVRDRIPFSHAVARTASSFDTATVVTTGDVPDALLDAFRGFDVLDARPGATFDEPQRLLDEIASRCGGNRRDLIVFDAFEELARRWGTVGAARFFTQCCPLLLGLGAIAHWSLVVSHQGTDLPRRIHEITQCVVVVGDETVRVAKAVGRPPGVEGSVFRYSIVDGVPRLAPSPAAGRLGSALKALRVERHLTQSELAEIAGVSPSAISQAERGKRGLSLETLLDLTGRIGITLDELLRGTGAAGYRLPRRDDPRTQAVDRLVPLLDDPRAGLRAYVLRLSPGGSAAPDFAHKGVELVAVAQGLVQVALPGDSPVLRPGEALMADASNVVGWRNLSDVEALVFWVLRD